VSFISLVHVDPSSAPIIPGPKIKKQPNHIAANPVEALVNEARREAIHTAVKRGVVQGSASNSELPPAAPVEDVTDSI